MWVCFVGVTIMSSDFIDMGALGVVHVMECACTGCGQEFWHGGDSDCRSCRQALGDWK